MTEKETEQQIKSRILILCVDRDGDIETKAGIKTPLLGRTANLDAAVSLALRDPEEPDANAMFEAVRLFDRLESEKQPTESFEVATISGLERGGVGADRKLVAELSSLLDSFSADEVILVSDGYSDEAILPLVESRVPVSSVRRIVVKHSESIEETAALFSRYMRLIWENPRYARIALGIPGLLFFLYGIFYMSNAVNYYLISVVLIFGGVLLVKGFGVDRGAQNLYKWAKEYSPPPLPVQISNYSIIAGVLCVAVSVYLGAASATTNVPIETPDFTGWINALPDMAGFFIKGLMDLMVVGIGIVLFGRSMRLYFERDPRLLRNGALIVSVAWSRWILDATANILIEPGVGFENDIFSNLVFTIVVGILIGIASVLLVIIIHRSTREFFGESDEDVDKFEENELAQSENHQ
jgi:putative membrane protein